jgi:magnesium chelatase subunit I
MIDWASREPMDRVFDRDAASDPAGISGTPDARAPRRRARRPAPNVPAVPEGRHAYPFSALVGQEEMKRALLIACIDPSVGGVLILGDRGTGKSTAVRSLAALLPPQKVVEGCAYGCDPRRPAGTCPHCAGLAGRPAARLAPVPVVDLPLGSTEDRIVGALDLERALAHGEKVFQPGLLARANRGFLYIDEVNLLEDHLVDLLIDVAASGENLVEREGLSVRHPARFVLVGSGNPEEGELRPQLLDRFGLAVEVRTPTDLRERIEVIQRRDSFDRDPAGFTGRWARSQAALRGRIVRARDRLATVDAPLGVLEDAARLCIALGTDGLRGELTLIRASRALAALEGKSEAGRAELRAVAPLVLAHRLRRNPLDDARSTLRVERAVSEVLGPP